MADTAAKARLYVAITNMRLPVSDLLTCVNQLCVKERQQLWNQCTSSKLYSLQSVIGRNTSLSLSRCDWVLINRLRIGHTRLTNFYLLKGKSQPVCQACHSPLTVKHILVDCTRYSAVRQIYFGVDTLKDVFENVLSRNIIAFVKDIGFYNRIYCCFYISLIALILTSILALLLIQGCSWQYESAKYTQYHSCSLSLLFRPYSPFVRQHTST